MTATHYPRLNAQDRPWTDPNYIPVGNNIWKVPTMLTHEERKMLCYLTEHLYQGKGSVIDLGCFLGGSSAFLAHGLTRNSNAESVKVESFDRFKIGEFERDVFFRKNDLELPKDDDSFEMFTSNIALLQDRINPNRGDILDYRYNGGPIEILFVDLMKNQSTYNHVLEEFLPHLIPNESIMILQDYMFEGTRPWHVNMMENLSSKFAFFGQTQFNSVIYRCTAPITKEDIEICKWENISSDDRIMNLARNATRWPEPAHQSCILSVLENLLKENQERNIRSEAVKKQNSVSKAG